MEKKSDGTVLRWGYLERKDKPFHTSISTLNEKEAIFSLKQLLNKMGAESKQAAVSLPPFLVFTAIVDSPDPKHVPAAPGTFQFGAAEINAGKFFLAAIPNSVIEKYQRIFASLGMDILRLEPESVPLARIHSKKNEPTLIVDVGHRSTSFTISHKGQVYFIAHTDFGVASGSPDVIINRAKEIAKARKIKHIVSANQFSIVNGL